MLGRHHLGPWGGGTHAFIEEKSWITAYLVPRNGFVGAGRHLPGGSARDKILVLELLRGSVRWNPLGVSSWLCSK